MVHTTTGGLTLPETRRPHRSPTAMQIDVVCGVGRGPTKLAAFDDALRTAGIGNYNLVLLSSVIPAGSVVIRQEQRATPPGNWGDRLYVVLANQRVDHPNEEAFAGLGWAQDESGRGLFVEHEGHSRHEVEASIEQTLGSMIETRGGGFGRIESVVTGTSVADEAACALVAAIYGAESWDPPVLTRPA